MYVRVDKSCSVNNDPIEETKCLLKNNKNIAICTIVENYTEVSELEKLLNEMGLDYEIEDFNGKFKITTSKGSFDKELKTNNHYLLYLDKNYLGSNNELGRFLIIEYFKTLINSPFIPRYIIFINEAVQLLNPNLKIFDYIHILCNLGTNILICEQSLTFFNIDYKEGIGKIVPVNEIIKAQLNSDKIIKL